MRFSKSAAIALVAFAISPAHAQSVVNGDFNTDISGWTTQGPNTFWSGINGPDSNPGVIYINDVPGIAFASQNLTGLTIGQTYDISAYYMSGAIFIGPGSLTASIDGVALFANPDTSYVSSWTPFSFSFTPTATTALLRFDTQVGNDSDYYMDKVVLTSGVAGTPEPGALALLAGLGVSASAFAVRRRQRRSL